jgi:hypothetical protein
MESIKSDLFIAPAVVIGLLIFVVNTATATAPPVATGHIVGNRVPIIFMGL